MYDHVVRAQRPSALEWLVVNALIPTVLMTFVLHAVRITRVAPLSHVDCYTGFLFPPDGFKPGGPVPDVFPVLIHMPEPAYPKSLRRAGIQDRVILRAVVNTRRQCGFVLDSRRAGDATGVRGCRARRIESRTLSAGAFRSTDNRRVDHPRYRFPSGGPMNALSSAVSITLHAAVGAALLLGTTKTVRSDPARPREVRVFLPREVAVNRGDGMGGPSLPGPIDVAPPDFNSISGLATTPEGLMPQEGLSPVFSPTGGSESSATTGWSGVPTEEHAEVLTGPLPVYPDLLRQAGVQGRVVLEA